MNWPFVTRKRFDTVLDGAVEQWKRTDEERRIAERRADRAEMALATAFGVEVDDMLDPSGTILSYRLQVHKRVLADYRGNPREMIADRLHRALDELIQHEMED